MRISIPGVPGVAYDTDARSTALTIACSVAGRRAPKPQGYALQVFPYLWSLEADLNDVPPDHPFQYLHPDGARSLEELGSADVSRRFGADLDQLGRTLWAVNEETERGVERLIGTEKDEIMGTRIDIAEETTDAGRDGQTDAHQEGDNSS